MKAREEMPLLRCALGPTGRPFGDGCNSVTASGTDGRKAVITRNWDMAGSTLKKPIRGRKMGVGAEYGVTKPMTLKMGETYGTAEKLVKLDGAVGVRILSYTRSPFIFEFKGEQGRNYVVEATGDLKEWKLLKTLSGVGSDIKFTDTRKSIFEKQYYRVKALE
jgi:hypothetical protein